MSPESVVEHSEGPDSAVAGFTVNPSLLSRAGELGLGLLWALFVLAMLFPFSGSHEFLWLTLPFGTLMSVHFLKRGFDSSPRLEVDASGIIDRTSMFGGELRVPWEDVLNVIVRGRGVELVIRDLKALQQRSGFGRRVEVAIRRLSGRKTMLVVPTFLGIPPRRLAEKLEASLQVFERLQLGLNPQPPGVGAPEGETALLAGEPDPT